MLPGCAHRLESWHDALMLTHLLYLHGFRSSPQSMKAQIMARHMRRHHPDIHWWCPQLPPSPKQANRMIADGTRDWPAQSMAIVGSSLGGFYATWLAEQKNCRAALLNPAVYPARDLGQYIGELSSWHDPEYRFFFRPEFIDELRALQIDTPSRLQRYFAIIAKGDEVLDWQEMKARYEGADILLLPAGDHTLSDFSEHLPKLLEFLELS